MHDQLDEEGCKMQSKYMENKNKFLTFHQMHYKFALFIEITVSFYFHLFGIHNCQPSLHNYVMT